MPTDDATPIRQQYLEIKREYPNSILFFRLGDFYETFDEDAELTARELDIVLTSRAVGKGIRVPLAGIPYHAVENYLARLIEKGYHVAICEQIGETPVKDSSLAKSCVSSRREPSTEPALLPGDSNNYLAAVILTLSRSEIPGICFRFLCRYHHRRVCRYRTSARGVARRTDTLHPAEVLYPDNQNLKDGIPGPLDGLSSLEI